MRLNIAGIATSLHIRGENRMTNNLRITGVLTLALLLATAAGAEDRLQVKIGDTVVAEYQAKPLANPVGGEKFKGSNFIHPLKTPSGFTVTDANPESDHQHHFGLWWPWKYVVVENGRKVLCWELQEGDGIVEAKESSLTSDGFTARSVYTDRKAPGGPRTIINETVNARLSGIVTEPAKGYSMDLEIIHESAIDKPMEILKYRYSGFSIRGTDKWTGTKVSVLTSEGLDYSKSNATRAKWVLINGKTDSGEAGILMMSHPSNHNHPERLRTWNPETQNGTIFVNFNPVQDQSWTFEPGRKYTFKYSLFVYDGTVTAEQAEKLWKDYINN